MVRRVEVEHVALDGLKEFSRSLLRPLSLGIGLVYESSRFTSRDNAVRLPAYTRLDASASFEIRGPRLMLALGGENLADARYVTSGAGSAFFAGPPGAWPRP